MNTKEHAVTQEEAMALGDGELSGAWKEFVSEHVEGCGECQLLSAGFRDISTELGSWKVEATPTKIEQAVLQRLREGRNGKRAGGSAWFARIPTWGKLLAAGAAAVLLVVIIGQQSYRRIEMFTRLEHGPRSLAVPSASGLAEMAEQTRAFDSYAGALKARNRASISSSLANNQPESASTPDAPMIARTVSLSMVVKDFAEARRAVDTILAKHHGYAAELNVSTSEGAAKTLQGSLRVPAGELAATLSELKALGRVENESQSGEEVTQQHADLMARLKNSRETEQRMQAILQQRTGKISDVLEVEQEIARVRGEIEQMETEQKSLEHRVEFATVNLNLADVYQAELTMPSPSVGTRLRNGVVAGLHHAGETLLGIALFFAEYGPALAIWLMTLGAPAVILWRRFKRAMAAA